MQFSRYPTGWSRNGRGHGIPHQGEREIARRLRHAARDEANQRARADTYKPYWPGVERVSRRGCAMA